jgi:hypothetical protein
MFDMEGKPIKKRPKIHNHNPTRIVYQWDPTRWPKDINIPEEKAISSTGNASIPDNAEVNFDSFEFSFQIHNMLNS